MKVLHVLLAGCLAWVCFAGTSVTTSGESVWSLADEIGVGVCSVWFVVAVCLFFKNRWPWYPRAAAIVKTLLRILNATYAGFYLTSLWAFCSDPQKIREDFWSGLLFVLAVLAWFVCGIGLFFKKRWAWWGNVVVILIAYAAILVPLARGGPGIVIALAFAGASDWMMIGLVIPWIMIPAFLLTSRADYLSKDMPPISEPETVSQPM